MIAMSMGKFEWEVLEQMSPSEFARRMALERIDQVSQKPKPGQEFARRNQKVGGHRSRVPIRRRR